MCLTADSSTVEANVNFVACPTVLAPTQKWTWNPVNGDMTLGATNVCHAIEAGLKVDNTTEDWNEMKQDSVNNVHLDTCDKPHTSWTQLDRTTSFSATTDTETTTETSTFSTPSLRLRQRHQPSPPPSQRLRQRHQPAQPKQSISIGMMIWDSTALPILHGHFHRHL